MPTSRSFPSVTLFGSARPVTCAVMDYSHRLRQAIDRHRPGHVALRTIEPEQPAAFVAAIADVLRKDGIAHLQLPIEGWGNSLIPGSALMAARLLTRRGRIVVTLHEWTSLNRLRHASMIPDLLATDGFILVSQQQRDGFVTTPFVSRAKKQAAAVIPIGPNVMPARIDPARIAQERMRTRGEGNLTADIVIGHFGVLYASKRPDLLLRVVRVLQDRGVKARLLVCGDFLWDKPKDRETFFALAKELDVLDWLDFRGRIDDEGELMATLAASDVFLLPFSDGISARRSSFQAISALAIPLVSTLPENPAEFALSPLLSAKIGNEATVLCATDSSPAIYADAIMTAIDRKDQAISVDLSGLWDEAAARHLTFYDRLSAS